MKKATAVMMVVAVLALIATAQAADPMERDTAVFERWIAPDCTQVCEPISRIILPNDRVWTITDTGSHIVIDGAPRDVETPDRPAPEPVTLQVR